MALVTLESTLDTLSLVHVKLLITLLFPLMEQTIHFQCSGLLAAATIFMLLMATASKKVKIMTTLLMMIFVNFQMNLK